MRPERMQRRKVMPAYRRARMLAARKKAVRTSFEMDYAARFAEKILELSKKYKKNSRISIFPELAFDYHAISIEIKINYNKMPVAKGKVIFTKEGDEIIAVLREHQGTRGAKLGVNQIRLESGKKWNELLADATVSAAHAAGVDRLVVFDHTKNIFFEVPSLEREHYEKVMQHSRAKGKEIWGERLHDATTQYVRNTMQSTYKSTINYLQKNYPLKKVNGAPGEYEIKFP